MQNKSNFAEENLKQNAQQSATLTLCPKCGTSVEEILETGFVGCEKCYDLPAVKNAIDKIYKGKKHKQ